MMKRILICTVLCLGFLGVFSQPHPPYNDRRGGDEDFKPAPVGNGLVILLAASAAFAAKKVYNTTRKLK